MIEVGSATELAAHSQPLKHHLAGFPAAILALVYELLIAAPSASLVALDGPQILAAALRIRALV
ncbi:MAG TPA: hypothetical protein VGU20_03025 [Stellaceae bacterium]|nr:hypothetical protein [Stellaceae bacterium]